MAEVLPFPQRPGVPDAQERARALDITRSWIVEAPAGSGKTGLLIQRFLKLLAHESVTEPAQVLAITFTRKATAEMRERVLAQLRAARAGTEPTGEFERATRLLAQGVLERDAQMKWDLLDHPRRLNIQTIDAVCMGIAADLPVLSGSGGSQTPSENAGDMHHEAARSTLMLLGGEDASLHEALEVILLHRDGNLGDCESLIAAMLAARDQWGELVPLAKSDLDDRFLEREVLPRLERALELIVCRGLTRLTKLVPAAALRRLCALAAEMGELDGYQGDPSPIAVCSGKRQPPQARAAHLEHWRALIHLLVTPSTGTWRKGFGPKILGFQSVKRHHDELKQVIADLSETPGLLEALGQIGSLPPATYPPDQWRVAKALFRVLSRALTELQLVFAESGTCDFAEVGLLARSALRHDSAVDDLRASLGYNLQHLLVDEMQDTSSSQYELVQLLTRHWDGHGQTVFLVGDPKQSIYLFRQARVERFVQTMLSQRLGDVPLGVLRLTANFRSHPALVEAFNHDFSRLFPAEPDPGQPEHVPYKAASAVSERSGGQRIWHGDVVPYSADKTISKAARIAQTRDHARQIRVIIEDWQARSLPADRGRLPDGTAEPWKIAVLVRNRSHLRTIVAALKQPESVSIPYRAVEIEPLGDRQEILELEALTRALLHPADRAAWLGLLRTPWCGLSLADLHRLTGLDDDSFAERTLMELIDSRVDLLSEDGIRRLQPFWSVMHAAVQQRGRLPLSQWVERTWRAFGAHAYASSEELVNAERFFQLLDELEEFTGSVKVTTLKTRLQKLYAAPSVHPGAVDLITIHKAKGLEWDLVLVPALEKTAQANSGGLLSWLEIDGEDETREAGALQGGAAPGIVAPIRSKGGPSGELNDWMKAVRSAREAAERKRLFYVACTRAREELHLFGVPVQKKDGSVTLRPDSLLFSAWPAAEAHFALPADGATILHMPEPQETLTMAAGAEPEPLVRPPSRMIDRIPAEAIAEFASLPGAQLRDPAPQPVNAPSFERPQGSFAARAFGNAMHAFLELLAKQMAGGNSVTNLMAEMPGWSPRIAAVLRAQGLGAGDIDRRSREIQRGLLATLQDAHGRWILGAHPGAASESSRIAWPGTDGAERSSIRLDRTFRAGAEPGSGGSTHLWIVDYKTSSHGPQNLEDFLNEERRHYAPILESYARTAAPPGMPVRLGLFYPLLPRLVWWDPGTRTGPDA